VWVELAIVLSFLALAVYVGGKKTSRVEENDKSSGRAVGGLGIGGACAAGVVVLVFGFHAPVSGPPVDVIFIILAIIAAASALEAAGGLEVLVQWAEWALQLYPPAVTFVAPLVAYVLTLLAGTSHIVYAILPVIKRVAEWAGVPVQRPLSIAVVASQAAITASPLSAATALMVGLMSTNNSRFGLTDILAVCIPAGLCGSMLGALAVCGRGTRPQQRVSLVKVVRNRRSVRGNAAVAIFLGAVCLIVLSGTVPTLRPMLLQDGVMRRLEMTPTIQMVMLSSVVVTVLACRFRMKSITETAIMRAGIEAVFSIIGVAWLGNCFVTANREQLVKALSPMVMAHPWTFSLILFALSAIMYSQAATVAAIMSVGFALNLPHAVLIAIFPAANGNFFLPTSPSIVAAVRLDDTGTTRGGWPNHSFMLPGVVTIIGSVATALLLVRLFYG
jgi:anaerobic C4-dicarboxylate transporter DcuA